MSTRKAWVGWTTFAAVMLLVTGAVNVIEGLVAIVQDEYVVLVDDNLYVVDVSGWGWVVMIFGLLLGAAGLGVLAGQTWARIVAIVVVAVHAAAQVFWIGAYPIWSLLMIALDVVILFTLTARWPGADMDPGYEGRDYEALAEPSVAPTRNSVPRQPTPPPAPAPAPDAQAPSR